MRHLFVPHDLALRLKEKGFDAPCLAWYDKDGDLVYELRGAYDETANRNSYFNSGGCAAPLYQQVTDWLEKKGYYAEVSIRPVYNARYGFRYGKIMHTTTGYTPDFDSETRYETWAKAIKEVLFNIKK